MDRCRYLDWIDRSVEGLFMSANFANNNFYVLRIIKKVNHV